MLKNKCFKTLYDMKKKTILRLDYKLITLNEKLLS